MIPGLFTPYSEHADPRGLQNVCAADLSSYHNMYRMLEAHGVVYSETVWFNDGAYTSTGASPNKALWDCFRVFVTACARRGDGRRKIKRLVRRTFDRKRRERLVRIARGKLA